MMTLCATHRTFDTGSFLVAATRLNQVAGDVGETDVAAEARSWADQATDILIALQLNYEGRFIDEEQKLELCQPEHSGSFIISYVVDESKEISDWQRYRMKWWSRGTTERIAGMWNWVRNIIPSVDPMSPTHSIQESLQHDISPTS